MYQHSFVLRFILVIFAFLGLSIVANSQQLRADEIIGKHIASIGSPEAIAKAKGRMAIGKSEFIRQIPRQTATGHSVMASDGSEFAFHSTFDLQIYPMERIGIFSNKITIPLLNEGMRSPLGAFLMVNDKTLRDRIFGGTIFSTWRLLDLSGADGKFEADGKKKINGRETFVLAYRPKSGLRGGSTIKLYFDAENFHHVRTVMELSEPDRGFEINGQNTQMTPANASNGSVLMEDFGDYKEVNGLVLPHNYNVSLTLNGYAGTAQFKWNFTIVEYRLVNNFGKGFFSFTV
jgi:hypothetical protein